MVPPKYVVNLSAAERDTLTQLVRAGTRGARTLTRARVLLKADEGLSDSEVAAALDVGVATVHRIRQRCVEEGLEAALRDRPRDTRAGRCGSSPTASSRSGSPSAARTRPSAAR